MTIHSQFVAQTQEDIHAQAELLASVMRADLEWIKEGLSRVGISKANPNQCLYYLSYHNDAECIKFFIPLSDPTNNHSEALRTAVQYGNPLSVALLLPVSAPRDCQDVLCEIAEQAVEDTTDEWLNALAICLNIAPAWAAKALRYVVENDCTVVAHILYPYLTIESVEEILEKTKDCQNTTHQEIHTRFKLEAIKFERDFSAQSHIKKL